MGAGERRWVGMTELVKHLQGINTEIANWVSKNQKLSINLGEG